MNGPDTHGLTGISSVQDRKDTTKGTAVKDTISIGRAGDRMGMEVHDEYVRNFGPVRRKDVKDLFSMMKNA